MNDNEQSPPRVVPPSHRRTVALTHVELTWIEKTIEHWLRFGRRAEEKILDRRRSVSSFKPGSIFAFVRWVRIPVIVGTHSTRWWAPIPRDRGRRIRPTSAWSQALV